MSIIIVEGPDGAGKTTLIQNLRKSTKRHFLTLSRNGPPRKPEDLLATIPWIASCPKEVDLVCDRHPLISEPIYGPHVRGEESMIALVYPPDKAIEILYHTVDKVIYCRPPLSTIIEEVNIEDQMPGVNERIAKIVDLYDEAMDTLRIAGLTVIQYDWTGAELTLKYTGRTADLEKIFFERRI